MEFLRGVPACKINMEDNPMADIPEVTLENDTNVGIDPAVLKAIYRQMSRIREVDKGIQRGLSGGQFRFSYWPGTGQEAIPATLAQLTDANDYMLTIYRGMHDQVAKGVPLKGLFAEALGRADGINKGKGGAPHISDPSSGSMLTTGIVGANAPIANGLALAVQMRGENRVTIANFGDGATSIGAVHEAMGLAGLWKLPIIFMCQNNQVGEYTLIPEYTACPDFSARAAGYGFRGVKLDGNDPISFYREMKKIIAEIRDGGGPVFVEAVTMRLGPHFGVGDTGHLSKEDLAVAKANWPVPKTRALLIETGICTPAELDEMDAAHAAEVKEALEFALASPPTPASDTFEHVYGNADVVPRRGHYPFREAEGELPEGTKVLAAFEANREAMDQALASDPAVFLLGEDIGEPAGGLYKTTDGLQAKYGKHRVRNTPIAEQAIIGAAAGAAMLGMKPVPEIMFSDFTLVCMDQISNHVAKQRYMSGGLTTMPITIRVFVNGGIGGSGAQHSQSLEALMLHTPGLKVVYPSTAWESKGLLTSCIFDEDPCVYMESTKVRGMKSAVPVDSYRIPIGVAKVKREGTDISVITYGWQVQEALTAAEILAKDEVSVEVLDLRTLMPLDYHRILASVKKTRRALVVHAATEFCGLGGEICSTLNQELWSSLKGPADRLGAAYVPMAYSIDIETHQVPNAKSIAARIREMIEI
jgi:pyruvate/2-oxoglutarate/acetoin dehydrogenase E1 component/TPP-dependent pyruvate/acetoin dehydrogenase alpha subunit